MTTHANRAITRGIVGVILAVVLSIFLGSTARADADDSGDYATLRKAWKDLNIVKDAIPDDSDALDKKLASEYLNHSREHLRSLPTETRYEDHRAAAVDLIDAAVKALDEDDASRKVERLTEKAMDEVETAMVIAHREVKHDEKDDNDSDDKDTDDN
jgi:hypothetical protein